MRTTGTTGTEAPRRSALRDERGMLLVLTMIILLVVSSLAGANLINAFIERSIAKNQTYASVALNAADAGINRAIAKLTDPAYRSSIPKVSPYTGAGWPPVIPAETLPGGGAYEVTVSFRTDTDDRDHDCDQGETVLFNSAATARCNCPGNPDPITGEFPVSGQAACTGANHGGFGYTEAKETVSGQGYPVITINSKGRYEGGAGYREVEVDLGRIKPIPPGVQGAVTSKEAADFGPSASQAKDGRAHAMNGLLCDGSQGTPVPPCECDEATQGLSVEGDAGGGVDEFDLTDPGNEATVLPQIDKDGDGDYDIADAKNPIPFACANAWCVLDYPSEADLLAAAQDNGRVFAAGTYTDAQVSAALDAAVDGQIFIVKGNFTMAAGTGEPLASSSAKILIVEGTFDSLGNSAFKGLIIANNFNATGNLVVSGATVCTGDGNPATAPYANGTVTISFSCDSLAAASGNQGYTNRISWRRLR